MTNQDIKEIKKVYGKDFEGERDIPSYLKKDMTEEKRKEAVNLILQEISKDEKEKQTIDIFEASIKDENDLYQEITTEIDNYVNFVKKYD